MRALVTGAAGFIGSHLSRALVAEGHAVRGLDDLSDALPGSLDDVPELDLIQADLRDPAAVTDAARGADVIFHLGAKRSVARSLESPIDTTATNVLGTLHVVLAAREHGARMIASSSSSVYGDQPRLPLVESMRPAPISPYGASKLAAEAIVESAWRSYRIPAISLRYFNVFGPGQDPANEYSAVIPRFVDACLSGARPTIDGDGGQSRDFTFIADVLDANLRAVTAGADAQGEAFNIGGGSPIEIRRLLELIGDVVDVDPHPVHGPPRPGDVRRTHADVSRAAVLLGWRPRVALREGLTRTIAALRGRIGDRSAQVPRSA